MSGEREEGCWESGKVFRHCDCEWEVTEEWVPIAISGWLLAINISVETKIIGDQVTFNISDEEWEVIEEQMKVIHQIVLECEVLGQYGTHHHFGRDLWDWRIDYSYV